MDQYTAQSAGASLQKDSPGPSEKGAEPTGTQILAAIESSSRATQTQIAAIAADVNLLRADLRVVVERSVATEQKVACMQSDVDTKASVPSSKLKRANWKRMSRMQRVRTAAGNSHLRAIYATPCGVGVTRIREYLGGLRLPRLTEAQSVVLEGEVSLDDVEEALGGMASGKAAGPDGLPVNFLPNLSRCDSAVPAGNAS
ncbi:hypothetical protein NDU88_009889 [Pleurodeles waltl]|uniref:Uncharacterized protein n=1 Tax=Pleurodeles waltl TaxID=8319 RepID=A0AAV7QVY4_PLEWA|nr:hypothetical protein NDU88_009889 [Pleurodeles waltl]